MVDLNAMGLFVRIVELGGFSAASRAMGTPKSSLSRRIAELERRLGSPLMRRNSRGFSLTETGRDYFERCRPIVAAAENAENEIVARAGRPTGLLRVTATIGFGQLALYPAISGFLSDYPEVRVELHLTDQRVNVIRDGFDLAVRMGALEDSELVTRRLGGFRRVICGSPAYFARVGAPSSPTDLKRHKCLVIAPELATWRLSGPGGAFDVATPWRFAANHIDIVRRSAIAGLGVANLPAYMIADDLSAGRLTEALRDYTQAEVDINGVYAQRSSTLPGLQELLARISAEIATF